jgi:hypothetical protein
MWDGKAAERIIEIIADYMNMRATGAQQEVRSAILNTDCVE